MTGAAEVARRMGQGLSLQPGGLCLALDACTIRVRSNAQEVLDLLARYFRHVVVEDRACDIDILAYERPADDFGLTFVDWRREAGKTGRKDAYVDLPEGRAIRKVRTGMVFLQTSSAIVAAGPCLAHDSQLINFVNAQYMTYLQQRDWVICHAAGLVKDGKALAVAGFSGGGKSTLMLKMLDDAGAAFLTNDRLLVRQDPGPVATGIPKLPRINPGTVLTNEKLVTILPEARRTELAALPTAELWDIEEKYDVDVLALYGPDRIRHRAPLHAFMILNWSRDGTDACRIARIDIATRPDLLAAVMKSPGPFYQLADGSMYAEGTPFDVDGYLAAFAGVVFYEVTGRIDFDLAARFGLTDALTP